MNIKFNKTISIIKKIKEYQKFLYIITNIKVKEYDVAFF